MLGLRDMAAFSRAARCDNPDRSHAFKAASGSAALPRDPLWCQID
jgi:hypothetical protein